jgi:hypothetical protein
MHLGGVLSHSMCMRMSDYRTLRLCTCVLWPCTHVQLAALRYRGSGRGMQEGDSNIRRPGRTCVSARGEAA